MLTDDEIRAAMRRAFNFGQTFWQQADSESNAQNKRADVTYAAFKKLVDDTVSQAALKREGETR